MSLLLFGLLTGMFFGLLMQKAQVIRYDKQIGALRLIDMTIVKYLLSAVMVAMVGVYALNDLGIIAFKLKPTVLGGNIIGGLIFGIGWGLLGYCPGTQVGALGEGRWDALWGIIGMLIGGIVFAEAYPILQNTVLLWGQYGTLTFPEVLGIHRWVLIPLFIAGAVILFRWFEKKGL